MLTKSMMEALDSLGERLTVTPAARHPRTRAKPSRITRVPEYKPETKVVLPGGGKLGHKPPCGSPLRSGGRT